MKKLIIPFLALLMLSGCGTLRKNTTSTKTDETTTTVLKTSTKTVLREKADTTIRIEPDTAIIKVPFNSIKEEPIKASDGFIDFYLAADPETGDLSVTAITKPKDVPVVIDREIETETINEASKTEEKTAEIVHNEKVREPAGWFDKAGIFLFALSLLFLLLLLLWRWVTNR